ncbi:MAG: VanZ family protein [Bacteroidales bacterium]|nr:VanZ family protein [Bacteroidales bacterium]
MMSAKARKIFRILLILYLISILVLCFANLSSLPDVSNTLFGIDIDKVAHFLMFLPFPALFFLSFEGKAYVLIGVGILAGLSVAGTTEWVQSFLTYRSMDLADFIADTIGLLSGALLTGIAVALFRKK